jgi:hypothetical protein
MTDDDLLDLQCCVDDQKANTEQLLADMHEAAKDGHISPEEWRHIGRHMLTEHAMNQDAQTSTRGLRTYFEKFNALVAEYRARLEKRNAPARASRRAA